MDTPGKPFFINGAPIEIWVKEGKNAASQAVITKNTIPPIFKPQKIDGPEEEWFRPFSEGSEYLMYIMRKY